MKTIIFIAAILFSLSSCTTRKWMSIESEVQSSYIGMNKGQITDRHGSPDEVKDNGGIYIYDTYRLGQKSAPFVREVDKTNAQSKNSYMQFHFDQNDVCKNAESNLQRIGHTFSTGKTLGLLLPFVIVGTLVVVVATSNSN